MKNTCYHELRQNYLYFKATGERNNFTQIIENTRKLYAAAQDLNATHVLADYRELIFNVPLAEAYNLVKVYENKLDKFYEIALVCVTNPKNIELIEFWCTVSKRRGFNTNVFLTIEEAEAWLKAQP